MPVDLGPGAKLGLEIEIVNHGSSPASSVGIFGGESTNRDWLQDNLNSRLQLRHGILFPNIPLKQGLDVSLDAYLRARTDRNHPLCFGIKIVYLDHNGDSWVIGAMFQQSMGSTTVLDMTTPERFTQSLSPKSLYSRLTHGLRHLAQTVRQSTTPWRNGY